ncbi:hypothetical protein [Methyloglobulus sp.]|uniref:hypothetical protein n=1 Tax=Methyloglobulus sp. TaxID=2518622 RepID=UPI0032B7AA1B
MKKLPEAVSTKFIELYAALNHATDDLKIAGAEANLNGDFSQVAAINDNCRRLQCLGDDIKAVLNRYESNQAMRLVENNKPNKNTKNRTRQSGGRLRVILTNKTIEKSTIAETFFETLKMFGLERVAKLNKVVSSIPLIAKTPNINGYQAQRRYGDWYVTTHVNKHNATNLLEEIGRELNIPVKIETVEKGFSNYSGQSASTHYTGNKQ